MRIEKMYGERLLCKQIEGNKTSEGGIILAGEALDDVAYATIVMVGLECSSNFTERMTIAYSAMIHPTRFRIDGEIFIVVHECDVMAWARLGVEGEY